MFVNVMDVNSSKEFNPINTRSVPGNHKDVCYFVNGSLKFKDNYVHAFKSHLY